MPTTTERAERARELGTPVVRALIVCAALLALLVLAGMPETWTYGVVTFAGCWVAYVALLAVLREFLAPSNPSFRVIHLGPEVTVNVYTLLRRLILFSAILLPVQWSLAILGYERSEVLLLLSVVHVAGLAIIALLTVYGKGGTAAFVPKWQTRAFAMLRRVVSVVFPLVCAGILAVGALEAAGYVNLSAYIVRVVWLNIPLIILALVAQSIVCARCADGSPHIRWINTTVWGVVALLQIRIWGLHAYHWVAVRDFLQAPMTTVGDSEVSAWGILRGLLVLVIVYLAARTIRNWLRGSERIVKRFDEGVRYALSSLTFYIILIAGVLWAMLVGGFPLNALTVFAGMAGIGLGFGLQDVVSNFIAGLILLIERPLAVGDYIDMEGVQGEVTGISLRSSTVRTADNVHIVIPNADFISSRVTNLSHQDLKIRLRVSVGVSYGSDMNRVREILEATGRNHPDVLEEPPPEARLVEFGDSSVNFDLLAWIPDPELRIGVTSRLYYDVWFALLDNDIEIPFPQRDLHLRSTVSPGTAEATLEPDTPPPDQ
jgi:small-conductance mechanosensitive channel